MASLAGRPRAASIWSRSRSLSRPRASSCLTTRLAVPTNSRSCTARPSSYARGTSTGSSPRTVAAAAGSRRATSLCQRGAPAVRTTIGRAATSRPRPLQRRRQTRPSSSRTTMMITTSRRPTTASTCASSPPTKQCALPCARLLRSRRPPPCSRRRQQASRHMERISRVLDAIPTELFTKMAKAERDDEARVNVKQLLMDIDADLQDMGNPPALDGNDLSTAVIRQRISQMVHELEQQGRPSAISTASAVASPAAAARQASIAVIAANDSGPHAAVIEEWPAPQPRPVARPSVPAKPARPVPPTTATRPEPRPVLRPASSRVTPPADGTGTRFIPARNSSSSNGGGSGGPEDELKRAMAAIARRNLVAD
eukprot:Unigene12979_Nuclearia_a/m.39380 Unigene12979_Nuclearia_a/g.39380  ORF Unigene12979_Nuclearia_a/g.39380 Unigene12979_Nuclearia_a/m.39380 type:complete len:369 (-) Unigene12979_Nuclearia_a:72-1178(-)